MADDDRVQVRYIVPVGDGEGTVELHIDTPLLCSAADRSFILGIMERVTEFARVAAPGAGPDPDRLAALVKAWEAEAGHLREVAAGAGEDEIGARQFAESRARELEGAAADLRRILADSTTVTGLSDPDLRAIEDPP